MTVSRDLALGRYGQAGHAKSSSKSRIHSSIPALLFKAEGCILSSSHLSGKYRVFYGIHDTNSFTSQRRQAVILGLL